MGDAAIRWFDLTATFSFGLSVTRVFDGVCEQTSAWWTHPYVREGGTMGLTLSRTGGLFEDWGGGQGRVHARLIAWERNRLLELDGVPPPGAVSSTVTLHFAEHLDQTSITVEHRAMGNIDIGSEDVYHSGWKDLLDIRLRAVIGG